MDSNVCLISSNDISREGLSHIIQADGFSVFASFDRADDMIGSGVTGNFLAVVDHPKCEDQVQAVKSIMQNFPGARVVVLAESFEMKAMTDCFHFGAHGYIVKSMKSSPLITALRLASLGEKVLPSELVEVLDRNAAILPSPADIEHQIEDAHLSPREFDVLCCLMAGCSNKVIARQLEVCEATVKVHVKAILRKLNVRNRTEAAIWASTRGIREAYPRARSIA